MSQPRRDHAALARALRRYDPAPIQHRLFVRARAYLGDLAFVETYVPRQSFVVDLGCGYGIFSNLLLEASERRRVLGVDVDERKIAIARLTEREGLRFAVADVAAQPPPPCDCVTIIDVLYLLPPETQELVLRGCAASLPEGGRLVVRAQEARPDPRYALTYAQEILAATVGLTHSRGRGFHFPPREEALALFGRCGFAAEAIPMRGRPYTDVLYLGRRLPRSSA